MKACLNTLATVFAVLFLTGLIAGAQADGLLLPQNLEEINPQAQGEVTIDASDYKPTAAKKKSALRFSPTETKVIRLNADAASVVVSNPSVTAVALDTPQTLIITPLNNGVSTVTVLDANSEAIFSETVIITAQNGEHITVHTGCGGAASEDINCEAVATSYYCPDGCYEVMGAGEVE